MLSEVGQFMILICKYYNIFFLYLKSNKFFHSIKFHQIFLIKFIFAKNMKSELCWLWKVKVCSDMQHNHVVDKDLSQQPVL